MKKLEELMELICEFNSVTVQEVKSKSRKQEVVRSRHLFHYFAWKYFKGEATLDAIGKVSNRDHATVMNSRDRVIPKWKSLNKQGRPFNMQQYNILEGTAHYLNEYYNLNDELMRRKLKIQKRMQELQEELKQLSIEALIQERNEIQKQISKLKS